MQLSALAEAALELLYPTRCQVCRTLAPDLLCAECRGTIDLIVPPQCEQCGRPFDPGGHAGPVCGECRAGSFSFDRARAIGRHTNALRKAIIAYKFHGRQRLFRPLGQMLVAYAQEHLTGPACASPAQPWPCDLIIPVPLHPKRRRWRGFDQAELLGRELSRHLRLKLRGDVLLRTRETRPQIELTPAQRKQNVRGAFAVAKPFYVQGRSLWLVDDVFTTGATLSECGRALKRAGAAAVYALTVSRSTPEWDKDRDLF